MRACVHAGVRMCSCALRPLCVGMHAGLSVQVGAVVCSHSHACSRPASTHARLLHTQRTPTHMRTHTHTHTQVPSTPPPPTSGTGKFYYPAPSKATYTGGWKLLFPAEPVNLEPEKKGAKKPKPDEMPEPVEPPRRVRHGRWVPGCAECARAQSLEVEGGHGMGGQCLFLPLVLVAVRRGLEQAAGPSGVGTLSGVPLPLTILQ